MHRQCCSAERGWVGQELAVKSEERALRQWSLRIVSEVEGVGEVDKT